MTPSELIQARESGISLVKIFPGNTIGPGFIKSAKEVFPDLLFMPTGGVNNENLKEWFKAGVSAVGMGSSLITKFIMDNNEFDFLKTNTKELYITNCRNQVFFIKSNKNVGANGKIQMVVIALLFFAKIINYPDRQEIGLLKDASGS